MRNECEMEMKRKEGALVIFHSFLQIQKVYPVVDIAKARKLVVQPKTSIKVIAIEIGEGLFFFFFFLIINHQIY